MDMTFEQMVALFYSDCETDPLGSMEKARQFIEMNTATEPGQSLCGWTPMMLRAAADAVEQALREMEERRIDLYVEGLMHGNGPKPDQHELVFAMLSRDPVKFLKELGY